MPEHADFIREPTSPERKTVIAVMDSASQVMGAERSLESLSPFSCDVTTEDGQAVVRLAGELDMATAPEVVTCVEPLAGTRRTVVLDLSELTFCDASGFNAFVRLQRRCQGHGTEFVLRHLPPVLMRVLRLACAERMFRVEA